MTDDEVTILALTAVAVALICTDNSGYLFWLAFTAGACVL